MHKTKLLTATAFIALLLTAKVYAEDPKATPLTPEQKAQIEGVIRDTIMKEPELIENSIKASMEKKKPSYGKKPTRLLKKTTKQFLKTLATLSWEILKEQQLWSCSWIHIADTVAGSKAYYYP
jgi:hypothetical protein